MKCSDWEDCIAYESSDKECQKEHGCMTEKNIKDYLQWCSGGRIKNE